MEPILFSIAYSVGYIADQVSDIESSKMTQQPNGVVNHPSWIIGHFAFAFQVAGSIIGVPGWLPEDWNARYGQGSKPTTDRSAYESKDEALEIMRDSHKRLAAAVGALDDTTLDQPFPDASLHYVFPTIRQALTQILGGHSGYHIGQLVEWRRAMGMPVTRQSYQ